MEQSRRLRKRDATHRSLMHSAKILFEENGLGNVTIDKIAEKADVSRSTFFSHFDSLDDLLSQIAGEEIKDIVEASVSDGTADIYKVFEKLNEDTFPYPYLMSEMVVRSILSGKESTITDMLTAITDSVEKESGGKPVGGFSPKDITAIVFGAYFGLVFQKFVYSEKFENPTEINDKIQQLIKHFINQEENKNE